MAGVGCDGFHGGWLVGIVLERERTVEGRRKKN